MMFPDDATPFLERMAASNSLPWVLLFAGLGFLIFKTLEVAYHQASWRSIEEMERDPRRLQRLERRFKARSQIILTLGLLQLFMALSTFGAFFCLTRQWDGIWSLVCGSILVLALRYVLPETYGRRRADEIVMATLFWTTLLHRLLWPVTICLHLLQETINTRLRREQKENASDEAIEQIVKHADEGAKEGAIREDQRAMIESVLQIHETAVSAIMTPRTDMICLDQNLSLEAALPQIIESAHSRIPVYQDNRDKIIGILYVKDVLEAMHEKRIIASLKMLCREPYFVPETKPVQELFREFRKRKIHIAIALDEYGGTAGLVTIEDIMEEIVGEIEDEHDTEETLPEYQAVDERTVLVDARLRIRDFNERFHVSLPEDQDYETVGGFVTSYLGEIPIKGFNFEYPEERLIIQVLDADERRLIRLKALKMAT